MYTFLIVILVLASLFLILAILLQSGKGGGLAATFGGVGTSPDSFFGTRQMGNVLTKSSWSLGGLFLLLGFVLSLMSSRSVASRSVLDQPAASQSATPAAPTPGPSGAPIPLENAPTTPPPETPRP